MTPFGNNQKQNTKQNLEDTVKAIDIHVHLHTGDKRTKGSTAHADAQKHFGKKAKPRPGADELAEFYRGLDMKAVIFDVDAETQTGLRISNDEVAVQAVSPC